MAQAKRNEWDLPHLRTSWTLNNTEKKDFWSVKFYPYTEPGVDPVFAVVGSKYIIVCRPPSGEKESDRIEEIQLILDEEDKADNYHCTWTKDSETGTPLLCVAGANAKIKIYDVVKGTLVREIAGHGGDINSLEVSPTNPQILASASTDSTIRIWSLDPAHAHQPCTAILAGGGHKENILTLAWHATGQYLLSGGVDHIINLWTIPELANEFTGTDKPTKIHYPHFSTSEVHSEIVDCITFYNDLIISKAEKDSIVLWSIVGFSSSNPPPPPASAPTMHDQNSTRSSFAPTPTAHIPATVNTFSPTAPAHQQFTRLFQFQNPDSNIMFTRFGFFPAYETGHAILAMCTRSSKVMFWDLARLEEYSELTANDDNDLANKRPAWLVPLRSRSRKKTTGVPRYLRRETSPSESATSASTEQQGGPSLDAETQIQEKAISDADMKKSRELWDSKYDMGDSLAELKPHKEEVVRQLDFVGRQVAWSVGGEWCCVVGSASVIALFQRWGGGK